MNQTINLNINIPAPPEGYGEVEFRKVEAGELIWSGLSWTIHTCGSVWSYYVARKLSEPWKLPKEIETSLLNLFGDGWLSIFPKGNLAEFTKQKPELIKHLNMMAALGPIWYIPMKLPKSITEPTLFKIGEPKE